MDFNEFITEAIVSIMDFIMLFNDASIPASIAALLEDELLAREEATDELEELLNEDDEAVSTLGLTGAGISVLTISFTATVGSTHTPAVHTLGATQSLGE